jgi:hypothetical protein
MMLKKITYNGPNPQDSKHIAGMALRASFRFNSLRWHGPVARLDRRLSDQIWELSVSVRTGGDGTIRRGVI